MLLESCLKLLLPVMILFIAAGRLSFWQGWIYGFTNVLIFAFSLFFLLDRHKSPSHEQLGVDNNKNIIWRDRAFWLVYLSLYFSLDVIGGLDSGRFGWSPQFSAFTYMSGCIFFLLANIVFLWASWTNKYFVHSSYSLKNSDHHIVREGPYKVVRHPAYAGAILLFMTKPLLLGSLWAYVPAFFIVILLVIKTLIEDRFMWEEVHGYKTYAAEVKFQLLPGIW